MYAYVILQDDQKFIKTVSDEQQEGAIKILVPLNWQRKFFEYPTKFWLDENKTLQGNPDSLPKDNIEDLENTVNNLKSQLSGVDLTDLNNQVNELNEASKNNDYDAINQKVQSIGQVAMSAQTKLNELKSQSK